ncbi:serine protease [Horticoccus luteus]|uniref:Serine protease n=1 Tax=Horticoccus luteus TaxID=2862869 RepID=A0A8F9TX28_9BACT|nr:NfeD family protein [Horticoccus luteus]QYM79429.1 serine protease [Horticoccus luteus]
MNTIILLFVAGLVLLGLEVFVPGGVLGVIGGLAMLGGCALAFHDFGPGGGLIASVVGAVLLGGMLYAEFAWLPRTRFGGKLFLRRAIHSKSQPPVAEAESVVGQIGEAATTLAPSGYVLVGGRRYEAFSQSGLIARGTTVKVVSMDNFRIVVSQPKET